MNRTKKPATNGTRPKKKATLKAVTRPVKKAKKEATLEDALFVAWKKTYETRHKRVA